MTRRQPAPYDGPVVVGIDVSKWQNDIDWDKVPTDEIKYAIIRTGDGKSTDQWFMDNWKEAKRVGIRRGSYHYFRADRDGKFQAEKVIRLIEEAGGLDDTDLPPAIDIEGGTSKNLPGGVFTEKADTLPMDLIVEECLEFLEVIEEHFGVTPLVYSGQTFHWWLSQGRPDLAVKFARFPLWTPDYRRVPRLSADSAGKHFPWKEWTIWQYTSKGKVPGIQGGVDMNHFRGTEEDLEEFVKSLRVVEEPCPPEIDNNAVLRAGLIAELEELICHLQANVADLKQLDS